MGLKTRGDTVSHFNYQILPQVLFSGNSRDLIEVRVTERRQINPGHLPTPALDIISNRKILMEFLYL